MKTSRAHAFSFCITLACSMASGAASGAACTPYVRGGHGGDYRDPTDRQGLEIVEYHFPKKVEDLVQGVSGPLGADIGYTLEHFPNHHRALAAIAKLGLRDKTPRPSGARYSIACYFDRAIRFVPKDATVRILYSSYLLAGGQNELAMEQLVEAVRLQPDHPTINYNLGLMYMKTKDYDKARLHAQKAYEMGFPLPGLKNKLIAAGQWRDMPLKALPEKSEEQSKEPGKESMDNRVGENAPATDTPGQDTK